MKHEHDSDAAAHERDHARGRSPSTASAARPSAQRAPRAGSRPASRPTRARRRSRAPAASMPSRSSSMTSARSSRVWRDSSCHGRRASARRRLRLAAEPRGRDGPQRRERQPREARDRATLPSTKCSPTCRRARRWCTPRARPSRASHPRSACGALEEPRDREPEAVERAPHDERPARAVPQPAEQHREHRGSGTSATARRGYRRARCRDSRAATSTARCASAARTPGGSRCDTACESSRAA